MDHNMAEIGGRKHNSTPAGLLNRRVWWRPCEAFPASGKGIGGTRANRLGAAGLEVDMSDMLQMRKNNNYYS
jgi:hypothetical protein